MRIVAANIAFREELFYKRWREFATKYNISVTLVGPQSYTYKKAGTPMTFNPKELDEGNFQVKHVNMKQKKWLRNDWLSLKFFSILMRSKPDIIYLIGYETKNVVFLSQLYRIFFKRDVKIGLFTMRGIDLPLHGIEYRTRWTLSKNIFDFVNVHYPHGKSIIENQGKYTGPIQLQTQIGVDKDIFHPNDEQRQRLRQKYGIDENTTVFSSAIRIEDEKGVLDIIDACYIIKDMNYKYLLMGDGVDFGKVKAKIYSLQLENKIILTGRVKAGPNVAAHLNATDCFVHVPKTTKKWVDTFPLAVVQAMATGLPVIGSDSGAVPYQLGDHGFIVPEKSPKAIAEKMRFVMNNRDISKERGNDLLKRVLDSFEIKHLNECLYQTFTGVLEENNNKLIKDQVNAFK